MHARLLQMRDRLVPDELQLGWMPFLNLGYLAFLFLPSLFGVLDVESSFRLPGSSIGATLISLVVFLPLYFLLYRSSGRRAILCMLAIGSLAIVLLPFNTFSNTYLIYAAAGAAYLGGSFRRRLAWVALMMAAFLLAILQFGVPLFVFAITAIVALALFLSSHFQIENERKRIALRLSHDEIKRLAALAERERIGRDLHDLLGHTLSLIALKSELADRLLDRDPAAARREIGEVTWVARDALSQVRLAVTGIRAAGLASELASARRMLEAAGIRFSHTLEEVGLQADQETALALAVREAATNIQRHAQARKVDIFLSADQGRARLRICDDGRGADIVPGHGLNGMRERIEGLDGSLKIESQRGRGTCIDIEIGQR
jgi:two-component system sensor histidine kinase DesK